MGFDPYLVDRPLDAERMSRCGGDRLESSRAEVPDEELLTSAATLRGVVGHSAAVGSDNFDWRCLRGLGRLPGLVFFGPRAQARIAQ
jgi:hypothetical protein